MDTYGVRYQPGQSMTFREGKWMSIEAYDPADQAVSFGYVIMPERYYGLWRRLLWGGLWYERMWGIWEEEAKKVNRKKKLSMVDNWVREARRAAALRAVWYRAFQWEILSDLFNLEFEEWDDNADPRPIIPSFIEFGIRDYRSWHFDSFKSLSKQDREWLSLDPTAPQNASRFGECLLFAWPQTLTNIRGGFLLALAGQSTGGRRLDGWVRSTPRAIRRVSGQPTQMGASSSSGDSSVACGAGDRASGGGGFVGAFVARPWVLLEEGLRIYGNDRYLRQMLHVHP